MTRREKVLATTLLGMLAVVGGGAFFYLFVFEPIGDARAAIVAEQEKLTKAQTDLAAEEAQIKAAFRVNPRLSQWQKISLPPADPEAKKKLGVSLEEKKKRHLSQLQVEYERYLFDLLRKNGFRNDSIAVKPDRADRRSTPLLRAKEPVYDRLAFAVSGRGNVDSLTRMLKAFHTTPLLHQVRSLTVALAVPRGQTPLAPGTLDVTMTVEALLVNEAEDRSALLPSKLPYRPQVLAEPARNYDLMGKRNMFTGTAPLIPASTQTSPGETSEDRREALRFVKLTMLWYNEDRRRWEATLYDQAKGGSETALNTRILSELKVYGKGETPLLDAKVMLIDEKQLIFKEEGKFYRMRLGDFLYPAVRAALPSTEVREMGLTPGS